MVCSASCYYASSAWTPQQSRQQSSEQYMPFYWTLSRKDYPNRVTIYEYSDFIKLYFIHAIYLPPAHSKLTPVYVETWRQQIEGQNVLTET